MYLDISETEIEKSVGLAEKYLIQVLYRNNLSTTFDDLRYWVYHFKKNYAISELPPTSTLIHLHILRAFYLTYNQKMLLKPDSQQLNPLDFGYEQDDTSSNSIVPKNNSIHQFLNLYPVVIAKSVQLRLVVVKLQE